MTPAERLDGYAALGLDVYLGADGRLRVRGSASRRNAARPTIRQHKAAIVAYLRAVATAAKRRG